MSMFKPEWPKVVKDPYGSGNKPPARPMSNHQMAYSKSVYDSKYIPPADMMAHKGEKVTNVGNRSKMQPKDMSKMKMTMKEEAPSFAHAMKGDKYSA